MGKYYSLGTIDMLKSYYFIGRKYYIDTDARYMSSYEMDRLRILSRYILHRYPIPSHLSIDEIKYCVNDMIITKKLLSNIWGYYDDII